MNYKDITFKELQALLTNNTVLIDVRSEEEYQQNHLKHSKNLPLASINLDKIISLCNDLCEEKIINKNEIINLVFYCRSGIRSLKSIDIVLENENIENNVFLANGYVFNIYNLKGGISSVSLYL